MRRAVLGQSGRAESSDAVSRAARCLVSSMDEELITGPVAAPGAFVCIPGEVPVRPVSVVWWTAAPPSCGRAIRWR
jgi:hypothetical protein